MLKQKIKPIILCGGVGTRLWPLSTESFPKQFLKIINSKSLLELTLDRCNVISCGEEIIVIGSEKHEKLITDVIATSGVNARMILEPTIKNTAAAICLALNYVEPDEMLIVMPADHYLECIDNFVTAIQSGIKAAKDGSIVTFGVHPTQPNTGYGYIECEDLSSEIFNVLKFIEKPPRNVASELILKNNVFWNSGIFLATVNTWKNAFIKYAPEVHNNVQKSLGSDEVTQKVVMPNKLFYNDTPSISVDNAIMENHDNIKMVGLKHVNWSDIGSWSTLAQLTTADSNNNRKHGDAIFFNTHDSYVRAEVKPIVIIGLSNIVVVDTRETLLIMNSSSEQHLKEVVNSCDIKNLSLPKNYAETIRPWGSYTVLSEGLGFKVKKLYINPGSSISLQLHEHRSEHWVIVDGEAEVVVDETTKILKVNESIFIPPFVKHRLSNKTSNALIVIEVQSGNILVEEDIKRFDDIYGRN